MSNIIRRSLVLGLALLVALALAAPALAQGGGEAQVRVAHLSPDAPNVDIYVNGEPVSELLNVPYTTISPYLPLPAGTQQVTVYAAGETSNPVIDAPVKVAAGGAYTIAAVGLVTDGSITAQVHQDDLGAPSSGNAKVRVVHASPDAGPVDVVPRGGDPLVEGLTFPDATPYAEVPAGTYTLDVNPAGTDDTVLTLPGVALADGAVYSAFAVGTVFADSLDVLLVQDNGGGGAASASASASASAVASASASASATASPSASARPLPDTGGSTWIPLTAALALAGSGVAALALVRRLAA